MIDRFSYNFVKLREFSLLTSETDGLKFHGLSIVLLVFGWLSRTLFIEHKASSTKVCAVEVRR